MPSKTEILSALLVALVTVGGLGSSGDSISPAAGAQFESSFPIVFRGRLDDNRDPPDQLEVSWFSTVDDALNAETTMARLLFSSRGT